MQFKQLIGVVLYGTALCVVEGDRNKECFRGKWPWGYNASKFPESVQNADVYSVSVKNDTLMIGIITED